MRCRHVLVIILVTDVTHDIKIKGRWECVFSSSAAVVGEDAQQRQGNWFLRKINIDVRNISY